LIGAPLGIRRSRSGKSAGIAIALLVFLVYFIILSSATDLAQTGMFPAYQAYWVPNILMTVAALFFIMKKGQEVSFTIGSRISHLYYGIKSRLQGKT